MVLGVCRGPLLGKRPVIHQSDQGLSCWILLHVSLCVSVDGRNLAPPGAQKSLRCPIFFGRDAGPYPSFE